MPTGRNKSKWPLGDEMPEIDGAKTFCARETDYRVRVSLTEAVVSTSYRDLRMRQHTGWQNGVILAVPLIGPTALEARDVSSCNPD